MSAELYYNDYALKNNSSGSIINERRKILVNAQKIKIKRNARTFISVSVLLGMFIILIYLYGQLMEVDYSLNYSKNQLNTLSVKIEETKAIVASQISVDQIKEYAEVNLGMRDPSSNQIKYLSITKTDSTLLCAPTNNGKNAFDFLLSIFK
jgi:hypothetical protein